MRVPRELMPISQVSGKRKGMRIQNDMSRSRKLLIVAAAFLVLTAGGIALGQAMGDSGTGEATGPAAERAGRAALEVVGGGEVVRVERSHEAGAAWKVEVLKPVPGLDGPFHQTTTKARRGEVLLDADLHWVRYTNTGWGETR